jgi:hypothetical protein
VQQTRWGIFLHGNGVKKVAKLGPGGGGEFANPEHYVRGGGGVVSWEMDDFTRVATLAQKWGICFCLQNQLTFFFISFIYKVYVSVLSSTLF